MEPMRGTVGHPVPSPPCKSTAWGPCCRGFSLACRLLPGGLRNQAPPGLFGNTCEPMGWLSCVPLWSRLVSVDATRSRYDRGTSTPILGTDSRLPPRAGASMACPQTVPIAPDMVPSGGGCCEFCCEFRTTSGPPHDSQIRHRCPEHRVNATFCRICSGFRSEWGSGGHGSSF